MSKPDDDIAAFERAALAAKPKTVMLTLFIAGMGPRSTQAVADIKALRQAYGDLCTVEIVDIYENPGEAAAAQVVAVPALVRNSPPPVRKLIGTLGNIVDAARSLGISTPMQESMR
jgi:circadian clock protein KaiB